jgi:Mannosyltransferase (PIG-V)
MPESQGRWRAAASLAFAPWLATRLGVLVAGYAAARVIGYDPPPVERAVWRESSNLLLNLPARWDAFWYLDIARHGYQWDPRVAYQQNVVFFPAYPSLIAAASWLTGAAPLMAGLALSLVAFYGALVYLRRLAALDLDEAAVTRAVWLVALYPFALFFGAVYTESLFLLALTGAFWHARQRQWARAAVFGLIGGLARPNGCMMALPLALLAILPAGAGDERRSWPRRISWPGMAAAVAPLLGALLYSAYLGMALGEPLAWVKGQAAWGTLWHRAMNFDPRWPIPPPALVSTSVLRIGDLAATAFAVAGIWPIWKRFGAPYAVLVAVSILPPLITHGAVSMGRFTAVQFPLFFWIAAGPSARRMPGFTIAFAAGQLVAAALFYSWRVMV